VLIWTNENQNSAGEGNRPADTVPVHVVKPNHSITSPESTASPAHRRAIADFPELDEIAFIQSFIVGPCQGFTPMFPFERPRGGWLYD